MEHNREIALARRARMRQRANGLARPDRPPGFMPSPAPLAPADFYVYNVTTEEAHSLHWVCFCLALTLDIVDGVVYGTLHLLLMGKLFVIRCLCSAI